MRSRKLPKWVAKLRFQRSGLVVHTTTTTHAVYYKTFASSLRVILGGCSLRQSSLENYFILIGGVLKSKKTSEPVTRSLHWQLSHTLELRDDGLAARNAETSALHSSESAESLVEATAQVTSFTKISIHLKPLSAAIYPLPKNPANVNVVISSGQADLTFSSENKGFLLFPPFSRSDGFHIVASLATHVLITTDAQKDTSSYLIEPWPIVCLATKVAGDARLALDLNAKKIFTVPFSMKSLELLTNCSLMLQSALTFSSRRNNFSQGASSHRHRTFSSPLDTTLTIFNSLGVDIRLWISGAGFNESSDCNMYLDSPSYVDSTDDLDVISYSHQAFVLAGGSVSVVFNDPLVLHDSSAYDGGNFMEDIRLDCEIIGWKDVHNIKLARDGTLFYRLEPLPEGISANESMNISKDYCTLSNSNLKDLSSSPLRRWRYESSQEALGTGSPSRINGTEHVLDIFCADDEKEKLSPIALQVSCSSRESGQSSTSVTLSSNIAFKNDSGAAVTMLSRDNTEFDYSYTALPSGSSWPLPLPVIAEKTVCFKPSDGLERVISVTINEALLDTALPPSLRRSLDMDVMSISILPSSLPFSSEPPSSEMSVDITSWTMVLSPALTFCNATLTSIEIEVVQPETCRMTFNVVLLCIVFYYPL